MKSIYTLAAMLLATAAATPAFAQDTADQPEIWTGGYAGIQAGARYGSKGSSETLAFDTNLDGQFNDNVVTAAGSTTNYFAPGFCGGRAATSSRAGGCYEDKNKLDLAVHAGYDKQFGDLVVGLVAEYRAPGLSDNVSGFSSEPDAYLFRRKLQHEAGVRARAGLAAGNALFYVTGGGVWGKFKNSFVTSNDDNDFSTRGKSSSWGYRAGAGVEQRLTPSMSLGVQYLYTRINPKDYTVRVSGGDAGNPFLIGSTSGTDIRRSGGKFTSSSFSAVLNWRF